MDYTSEPILSVRDLIVRFSLRGQTLTAVRGASLDLYKGESLAIVGESGSGKSVFTKSFMGMLDANGWIDNGSILYDGQDLAKYKTEEEWLRVRGKRIAMVFQDPMTSLSPLMTVGRQIAETLELHQGLKGKAAKARAIEILRDVGITDPERRYKQYPHEFSGGMRQRVVIAIACNPEILICDEPTTALDVSIRAQVLNLLSKLQRERSLTYLFISHDLSVMRFICDRIAVIHLGQIVELADTDTLYAHPLHPYTRALLSAIPLPNPDIERKKKLLVYDPSVHDYSVEQPQFVEIEPGHFVLGNTRELDGYRAQLVR